MSGRFYEKAGTGAFYTREVNTLLRAIIVDDEQMVRHGLLSYYHWDKYNIEIVRVFADGATAFEYLAQNHVDLLVTDIVMPRMNGIELAQKAREKYEDIKIIFISGYTDTKYLWGALKMNAVDYIFKSVDFDELDAAVERVVYMVEKRNTEREHVKRLEEQLQQNQTVLRQQQLVFLLSYSDETEEELSKTFAALALPLNSKTQYVVMVLRLSNKWHLLEGQNERAGILLDLKLQNALQDLFHQHGSDILFKKQQYEYISILQTESDEYAESLMKLSAKVQTELQRQFGALTVIGISERFRGLLQVKEAYKNACDAIYNRYVVDDNLPQVTLKKFDSYEKLRKLQEKHRMDICNSILDGQRENIRIACNRAVSETLLLDTPDEQQNHLIYLLMLPQALLRDLPPEKRGLYTSFRKLMERYLLSQNLQEQEDCILSAYLDAAAMIHSVDKRQNNALIQSVRDYIAEHYMKQISIATVAESVYLTPTYLCVLFKKHTGQTLNNYITDVRMQEAKRLLHQSNIHLQDICYQVGYLSPSYFSRLFRKRFGLSPSEYRASLFMRDQ